MRFLADQTSGSRYWPDDTEIREGLHVLPAYRDLSRRRLRMLLEAIEDHYRGWSDGSTSLSGERVPRGKYAIEHVMPRKWVTHWPLPERADEAERDLLIHTIGNLTLLTAKLNSKISNGPWLGDKGKRQGLEAHDVLFLNRRILKMGMEDTNPDSSENGEGTWKDGDITSRSVELAEVVIKIWPAPEGHRSGFALEKSTLKHRVDLADLLNAGLLQAGMPLIPHRKKLAHAVATLLPDGRIDVGGNVHATPSNAARAIAGASENGWRFFLVNPHTRRSLRDVRLDYFEASDGEAEGSDDDMDDEP